MLTFRWIENYLEQFSLVNHILTYIIYSETSSTYIWCRAMWQELKIKLNVDPVGLSALLEALKARVTSVLKFEGADVTHCSVVAWTFWLVNCQSLKMSHDHATRRTVASEFRIISKADISQSEILILTAVCLMNDYNINWFCNSFLFSFSI